MCMWEYKNKHDLSRDKIMNKKLHTNRDTIQRKKALKILMIMRVIVAIVCIIKYLTKERKKKLTLTIT